MTKRSIADDEHSNVAKPSTINLDLPENYEGSDKKLDEFDLNQERNGDENQLNWRDPQIGNSYNSEVKIPPYSNNDQMDLNAPTISKSDYLHVSLRSVGRNDQSNLSPQPKNFFDLSEKNEETDQGVDAFDLNEKRN